MSSGGCECGWIPGSECPSETREFGQSSLPRNQLLERSSGPWGMGLLALASSA